MPTAVRPLSFVSAAAPPGPSAPHHRHRGSGRFVAQPAPSLVPGAAVPPPFSRPASRRLSAPPSASAAVTAPSYPPRPPSSAALAALHELGPDIFADADDDEHSGDATGNGAAAGGGDFDDADDDRPLTVIQHRHQLASLRSASSTSSYASSSATFHPDPLRPPPTPLPSPTPPVVPDAGPDGPLQSPAQTQPSISSAAIGVAAGVLGGSSSNNASVPPLSADQRHAAALPPPQPRRAIEPADPFDSGSESVVSVSSVSKPSSQLPSSLRRPINGSVVSATITTAATAATSAIAASPGTAPSSVFSRSPSPSVSSAVSARAVSGAVPQPAARPAKVEPEVVKDEARRVTVLLPHITPEVDRDFRAGRDLLAHVGGQTRRKQLETFTVAVKRLEAAANSGPHPEAMRLLADAVYSPPSPLASTTKATEWTRQRAALLDTPLGMLLQATALFLGTLAQLEGTSGTAHFASAAGLPRSLPLLDGAANPKDGECADLLQRAAELELPAAMHEHGVYLAETGRRTDGVAWIRRAAEAGHHLSAAWLARAKEPGPRPAPAAAVGSAAGSAAHAQIPGGAGRLHRAASSSELADARRLDEMETTLQLALDPNLRAAIRSIEWGFYASGILQVQAMATLERNELAARFLDPDTSFLSPSGRNNAVVMYHLGQHQAARGDAAGAVKWYRRSADAGYHEAMVTLAAFLVVGDGSGGSGGAGAGVAGVGPADPGQAMAWLMKAWEAGHNKDAALALGEAYTKGVGVAPDPVKAVRWYARAWEAGRSPEAAFAVGLAFATGRTPGAVPWAKWRDAMQAAADAAAAAAAVASDPEQHANAHAPAAVPPLPPSGIFADVLFPRTATGSAASPSAVTSAGYTSVMPDSLPFSPRPAENASAAAARLAGARGLAHAASVPNLAGDAGGDSRAVRRVGAPAVATAAAAATVAAAVAVAVDPVKAALWYRRAVDQSGHARACNNLGELYMTGRGVVRDDVVGFFLFKRAAIAGLAEAEYNVGRCYREGRGCTRDEALAMAWFKKAEAKGIAEATAALSSTSS
ncbi:hypothetical protein HK405_003974 [Cladochytrium tenue]|nr:hypothetical protein HK405_003974 [Cladochytrium tenue]